VDGVGRLLQSFHDGLAVLQLSEHFPMTELCRGFHEARSIIHDDEALDAETLDQNGGEAGHAGISLGVAGNQAAEDDAAMEIHAAEHRLHDVAADVLKIDVDALGSGCGKFFLPVRMLVVDGGIEAEILGDPCAFVVAAGDAHDAAAVNLSNLPDDAAGGASGGGHDERVAFFRLGNLPPEKRGESVDAEDAEEYGVRDERNLGDFLEGALGGFIEDDILLKASEPG